MALLLDRIAGPIFVPVALSDPACSVLGAISVVIELWILFDLGMAVGPHHDDQLARASLLSRCRSGGRSSVTPHAAFSELMRSPNANVGCIPRKGDGILRRPAQLSSVSQHQGL